VGKVGCLLERAGLVGGHIGEQDTEGRGKVMERPLYPRGGKLWRVLKLLPSSGRAAGGIKKKEKVEKKKDKKRRRGNQVRGGAVSSLGTKVEPETEKREGPFQQQGVQRGPTKEKRKKRRNKKEGGRS